MKTSRELAEALLNSWSVVMAGSAPPVTFKDNWVNSAARRIEEHDDEVRLACVDKFSLWIHSLDDREAMPREAWDRLRSVQVNDFRRMVMEGKDEA